MGKRAPAGLPDPGTRSGHANIRMGKLCGRKGDSEASSIKEDHSAGARAGDVRRVARWNTTALAKITAPNRLATIERTPRIVQAFRLDFLGFGVFH